MTTDTGRQLTALVQQLSGLAAARGTAPLDVSRLESELTPNLLRGEAIRLQQQAADLLDQADQVELKAKLREAALSTDSPLEAALHLEEQLLGDVEAAVQAEREAEDEARAAVENHRQVAEAERESQRRKLSPAAQTDLLVRMRAAADVSARLQAAAEGAKAHRKAVEQTLSEARQLIREREAVNEATYALARRPPKAPMSAATAVLDGIRRLMWGQGLDEQAQGVVAELIRTAAGMTGVTRQTQTMAVEERDRELASIAFERQMPHRGHPLRPSNPTSAVFAVQPPAG